MAPFFPSQCAFFLQFIWRRYPKGISKYKVCVFVCHLQYRKQKKRHKNLRNTGKSWLASLNLFFFFIIFVSHFVFVYLFIHIRLFNTIYLNYCFLLVSLHFICCCNFFVFFFLFFLLFLCFILRLIIQSFCINTTLNFINLKQALRTSVYTGNETELSSCSRTTTRSNNSTLSLNMFSRTTYVFKAYCKSLTYTP